ncbi:hypothetical protein BN7_5679 [Wickerhamomyces ciferrii]|uniref:Uncharacterized protein n=1 Tax=Wickerhamomyces ciferrii (strain ATCC 14091 / BCRC 22168 / CBS 111 / JCM 3599 / NBRC 0793 / NRRL Y-1031 F-60-10) TaxID=1206466 RepID=K0KSE6_WICCF|nr:uncharacterized protein BN7_5679 [Wickerhamomyces ciferrii]CCH46091.1 hypothetical protein BN7_5679 [Wickerhamomyces ciferrii]
MLKFNGFISFLVLIHYLIEFQLLLVKNLLIILNDNPSDPTLDEAALNQISICSGVLMINRKPTLTEESELIFSQANRLTGTLMIQFLGSTIEKVNLVIDCVSRSDKEAEDLEHVVEDMINGGFKCILC